MVVTLIKKDKINSLYLPLSAKGQFWISDKNNNGQVRKLLSIEGISKKWYARGHRFVQLLEASGKEIKLAEMRPSAFYRVSLGKNEDIATLYCEDITEGRLTFNKYLINSSCETKMTVGRSRDNDIVFKNDYVSSSHCTLIHKNNHWTVRDNGSVNGTFVNGNSVSSSALNPGDSIYVLGLAIIIGSNFIAVNNPNNNVTLSEKIFKPYLLESIVSEHGEFSSRQEYEVEYFYRTPRFKKELEKSKFTVDPPPQSPVNEELPLILTIGPSVTMGMMALVTGGFAVMNAFNTGNIMTAVPAIIMSVTMLVGTLLWPALSRRYQKKRVNQKETARQVKYKEYINEMEKLIQSECAKQEAVLNENSVTVNECIKRAAKRDISLWERNTNQNDFLRLRVGIGNDDIFAEIKVPEEKFSLDDDNLLREVINMGNKPKKLNNVPISISFFDNYFTSVIGDRKKCIEFANGLIVQLTAHYGYDDIKTVFIYDDMEKSEFGYVKWLPHAWNNEKSFRMIATNLSELKEVSAYLESEIAVRKEHNNENPTPYYVIFALSLDLALRSEMLKQIYTLGSNINISVISFFDDLKNVPKECTALIKLDGSNGEIINNRDTSGKIAKFINDIACTGNMMEYSCNLANIFLDISSSSYQLPKMVTFMDMYGVSKVDHLNASLRWKENNPTSSLQAPIGVNTFGDLFYLDLHEKFHGPHGLVAGTTGSGKSEFIITYILSLALNYHPNEVSFILIDYKGGGMAKAFEKLPHVAGIITNLDGSAIKRSLVSINSELKYRQAVFNEASKQLDTRIADIYAYQKEYRNGKVKEPVPHLFIISDEFAELKAQQPEFMTELVSTARIGRSLGVHLILATQKPSGVVNDQIWSNSKFKISLKVQDRSDSMEMLKRPDAAELSDTGRFYLLVGNNEVFEMGQSAWAGANYTPNETTETHDACTISVLDINGRIIKTVIPETPKTDKTDTKKQLDVITDYISQTAREENVSTRMLWLPPIDAIILLDELHKEYPQSKVNPFILNPLVGEIDDPARQRRLPLHVNISIEGNLALYGSAGGGKATFITTMVYDLIRTHTSETLNMYLLDFGAETLRAFRKAPQIGDVVLSTDPEKIGNEKICNLLKMIRTELAARKKLFSDWGGDYGSYCERSGSLVPNIVIIINNYSNFKELYYDYEDRLVSITRDCPKYGVYFIFTATTVNAMGYRLTQNLGKSLALQLNDEMDYSGVVGRTNGLYPAKLKGRGLVNLGEVYEFQTAHIAKPEDIIDDIRSICDVLTAKAEPNAAAKRIPILPDKVNPEYFKNTPVTLTQIPLGICKSKLAIEYLQPASFITLIGAKDINSVIPLVQGIAEMLSFITEVETVVLDAGNLFIPDENRQYRYLNQDLDDEVFSLFKLAKERDNTFRNEGITDFEHKFYIIPSLQTLNKHITETNAERLDAVLECGSATYGMNIIICDDQAGLTAHTTLAWYATHCNGNGIWVGNGVTGQYSLKITKQTNELYGDIGDIYGIIIKNGKFKLIKLLQSDLTTYDEEDEDE